MLASLRQPPVQLPEPGRRLALTNTALAVTCAWALMHLVGPGLDPELRPIAAGLAGLAATVVFLLPRALGSGLTARPLTTAAGLALTAALATTLATPAAGPQPQAAVLMLVGLMALALAALGDGLKVLTGHPSAGAAWTLALVCFIAATPVWLLPLHGSANPGPWALDALVAVNPLTHLAVLTGTDWLRSDWFYRHSALGSLRYAYPTPAAVMAAYLVPITLWLWTRRRQAAQGSGQAPLNQCPVPPT
jgi:hypothetical protein